MSGGPTIVVKFGDSVADGSFFLVELDDTLNTNVPEGRILHRYVFSGVTYFVIYFGPGDIRTLPAAGVKSQFNPGDPTYFLLHYDTTKLQVVDIKTTSGMVNKQDVVKRSETDELFFASIDETMTLSHIPAGTIATTWFGRSPVLSPPSGRQVTVDAAPCIGKAKYDFSAESYKFTPPPMTLGKDEEYLVAIVIYVEAA